MSYRIVYGCELKNPKDKKVRWRYVLGYTVLCLSLFTLLTARFWPAGWKIILEGVLPGDAGVTYQALDHMAENLRSGQGITDAVTAFCREIVDGAKLSD